MREPGCQRHEALSPSSARRDRAAADPLGVAVRELDCVEQLGLGERADQEMGGAVLVEGVERRRVAAREQHQQSGGIGLDRVGDGARRLLALVERAASVDQRHRGARGEEARLGIGAAPRRDRLPAGALGQPRQLVAMAEGKDEERRPHCRRLARVPRRANRLGCGFPFGDRSGGLPSPRPEAPGCAETDDRVGVAAGKFIGNRKNMLPSPLFHDGLRQSATWQPIKAGAKMKRRGELAVPMAALAIAAAAAASETISYTYDARGRLVKVVRTGTVNNGVKAEYRYDKADNRTNVNVTSPNTTPPQ